MFFPLILFSSPPSKGISMQNDLKKKKGCIHYLAANLCTENSMTIGSLQSSEK